MKNKSNIRSLIIVAVLILVAVFFTVFKKENTNNNSPINSQKLSVEKIKNNVELINQDNNYETKTLNNDKFMENITDGGGQLIGYFKDSQLKKIEERLGLSYGVMTYKYYFVDGQLIMINEIEEDFPDPDNTGTLDYTKLEFAFEGDYYIKDDNLIYSDVTGKKRITPNSGLDELVSSLVLAAKQNVELLQE